MAAFRTTRWLPAPPAAVFAAIQEPERLARWWGPAGFTNTFHVFEFREGGAWDHTMHGPDGKAYANQAVFLEIVPDRRMRLKHTCPPPFELTLDLAPEGTGTRLAWAQVFEDAAFAESARAFLEKANGENLDRLAAEVAAGLP